MAAGGRGHEALLRHSARAGLFFLTEVLLSRLSSIVETLGRKAVRSVNAHSVLLNPRIVYAGHDFATDSVPSRWVVAPDDPAHGVMMATTRLIRVPSVFHPWPFNSFGCGAAAL
jgi:hypothetical protein